MSNNTKLYLIRHGETEWNALRRFQGRTDTVLSEEGIRQAALTADRLKNSDIGIIYSSPLTRAVQTAEPLAAAAKLSIMTVDELKEIDFGHWEGLTADEIMRKYSAEYSKCKNNPLKYGFRTGLTFNEVKETAESFVNKYIMGETHNIAVVSHSVIIKMLIITLLDLTAESFQSFHLYNCSVTTIDITPQRRTLLGLGDSAHILLGCDGK